MSYFDWQTRKCFLTACETNHSSMWHQTISDLLTQLQLPEEGGEEKSQQRMEGKGRDQYKGSPGGRTCGRGCPVNRHCSSRVSPSLTV